MLYIMFTILLILELKGAVGNSLSGHNKELISRSNYNEYFNGEVAELAEGARLLSEYTSIKGIEGSNPSLSAKFIVDKLH